MVKHTKTICQQIADKLFECVCPFCGIGTWMVKFQTQRSIAHNTIRDKYSKNFPSLLKKISGGENIEFKLGKREKKFTKQQLLWISN